VNAFIGVAKGELGDFFQTYLQENFGVPLEINGPLTQLYENGDLRVKFRVMRSRDVPRGFYFRESPLDYGLTGRDVAVDELTEEIYSESTGNLIPAICLGANQFFGVQKTLEEETETLGFPALRGRVVLLGRDGYTEKKDRLTVVVNDYYANLARFRLAADGLQPRDYDLFVCQGSEEGYLSGGQADLAVCSKYSGKTTRKENGNCANGDGPKIIEVATIIDTYPVVLAKSMDFRFPDLDNIFARSQK